MFNIYELFLIIVAILVLFTIGTKVTGIFGGFIGGVCTAEFLLPVIFVLYSWFMFPFCHWLAGIGVSNTIVTTVYFGSFILGSIWFAFWLKHKDDGEFDTHTTIRKGN